MGNIFFGNKLQNQKLEKLLPGIIIFAGIILRLFHYLYNRSLWMDEVYLSVSFFHMDYIALATTELDYGQKAPLGFLWMVKFILNIFGSNEFTLRLIPLTAGIVSLFIYQKVAKYFLNRSGQIIVLTVFAFAPAVVYHSVEIKQYATECFSTLIALYLFVIYYDRNKWKKNLLWGIYGGLILWFSYSAIFILTGVVMGIILQHALKRKWKELQTYILTFSIWSVSFLTNFYFFTYRHTDSDWVVYFFKVYNNFMPFPPLTLQQLKWFPRNFIGMMDYPLGFWLPVIPSLLLILGIYSYRRHHVKLYVLFFPILLTLIASGLHLYPLIERFWLFLVPILLIIIAYGFEYLEVKIRSSVIILLLMLALISSPILQSCYYLVKPAKFYKHKKSYEREALLYINNNFREGDCVYNYWNNKPGYTAYRFLYHFKFDAIQGMDLRIKSKNLLDYNKKLALDLRKTAGKRRLWVIFNNQFLTDIGDKIDDPIWYYKNTLTPNENLIYQLEKKGMFLKKLEMSDVSVYLYKLNYP